MAVSRNGAIDRVKTVAIIGTILIHVSAAGILAGDVGSLNWSVDLVWACLLRCAVPLFLMCSGALFLPPEKKLTLRTLWGKYILRIAAALFFWSGAYCLWDRGFPFVLRDGGAWEAAKGAFLDWVCFRHKYHLYYLVILLALYAILPLLRLLAQKGSDSLLRYSLAFWFVCGSLLPVLFALPPLGYTEGFIREYALPLTWAMAGYLLAGDYLNRRSRQRRPRTWLLLYLAGLAVTWGGTLILSRWQGALSELFLSGAAPGQVLEAVGLFGLIRSGTGGRTGPRWAETVSRASFCIYLLHPLFLDVLHARGFSTAAQSSLWAAPVQTALLFALCFLCWLVLRRIPIVNKYLI